ncbi:MAG TPA: host-nuclease inhibitor Gam family protein [Geothermobacteraceae bacterium]|nr:host-nuclease inhibitor Gam family protein [Geothermobacteraceae bacterium]
MLQTIEKLTREFADARQTLGDRVQQLQDEIEQVKRKHLTEIRALAGNLAVAHEQLFEEIKDHPEAFVKPKTQTIAGVRVGFKKEKGKTTIADEAATIKRIKTLLPAQVKLLVQIEEKLLKTPLLQLPGETLKKLGVAVAEDVDAVYIKPVGDDIDKFVAALLEEGEAILREVV